MQLHILKKLEEIERLLREDGYQDCNVIMELLDELSGYVSAQDMS